MNKHVDRIDVIEKLKKLVSIAVSIAEDIPEDYRKEAFIETYRYLLSSLNSQSIVSRHITKEKSPISYPQTPKPTPSKEKENIITLPDFVNSLAKQPKTNDEWITLFAYYMKHYEDKDRFNNKEIREYFKIIGLKVPGNVPRDIKRAIEKGYLAWDPESKNYYITRKGEELVRGTFIGRV